MPANREKSKDGEAKKSSRTAQFQHLALKPSFVQSKSRSTVSNVPQVVRFTTLRQRKTIIHQDPGIRDAMIRRQRLKAIVDGVDITPKNLGNINLDDLLDDLELDMRGSSSVTWSIPVRRSHQSIAGPFAMSRAGDKASVSSRLSLHQLTMDDIMSQMSAMNIDRQTTSTSHTPPSASGVQTTTNTGSSDASLSAYSEQPAVPALPPFIKIIVRETDDIELYASNSCTVPQDAPEAAAVIADNERYDYLTIGKGRARRTSEAEAQTPNTLYKSRAINTDRVKKHNVDSYVSNFDMFDTYAELEQSTTTLDADDVRIAVTTYKGGGVGDDEETMLANNENFKLSSMVLQRLLAGNTFRTRQKRFRNMIEPDPLDLSIRYLYRLDELWTYTLTGVVGSAVSCLHWCPANGDLLAVGYGVYDFQPAAQRKAGYVAVWSIKNPRNPERFYRYTEPVTSVAFSRARPQLLAVGTHSGSVEVLDISDDSPERVAVSERDTSPGVEPVWQIEWIQTGTTADAEELLTVAEDGLVMKYAMTNGPGLVGFRQIHLDRVVGTVEGLVVPASKSVPLESNRHPQALLLQIHPLKGDVFYVGTDEGCLHKCSTFYPHQYISIMQVHQGSIGAMQFSPWSPRIYLTCGSDWKVRVWVDEVFEPVLELGCNFEAVRCAAWSPSHSTLLACVTRQQVELWNIRKNTIRPASVTKWREGNVSLTTCAFSPCGRSLVVGDADGSTHVCALEDMPFAPHFQYEELEAAIGQALATKSELRRQVKGLGFLGYPKGEQGGRK